MKRILVARSRPVMFTWEIISRVCVIGGVAGDYESFFCIVNLHAITAPQDPKMVAAKTRELARIYLAVGIDPNVSTVFVQSDVPAHAD